MVSVSSIKLQVTCVCSALTLILNTMVSITVTQILNE